MFNDHNSCLSSSARCVVVHVKCNVKLFKIDEIKAMYATKCYKNVRCQKLMLKQKLSQKYARWNENVLKRFINENIDWAEQTFVKTVPCARACVS